MEYEPVIGLEVHAQLKTRSKMFTDAPYHYGAPPNTLTNPVVMGLPGTLPVLNHEAIVKTVLVGLMFDCQIASSCKWDRKNYFYPDLPKGYQISQYDKPLCLGGAVEIELEGPARNIMGEHRRVRLTRIHLEEDVGKLTHASGMSLVDYNRAGAPLIEIVSEPDLFSPAEVFAYLTSLRMHLVYAGISDCDMEKGQLRCDANISVRPKGSTQLGTKVELKNLNSISEVRNGVVYEIERQIAALRAGQRIVQETRRWDAAKGVSLPMRGKEMAHDYRYFPDPDLMPVKLEPDWVQSLKKTLPELPFAKQERFAQQYGLAYTLTSVLCPSGPLCAYFEEAVSHYPQNPKGIANLVANDILRELSAQSHSGQGALPISACKLSPYHLAQLVRYSDEGVLSKQTVQDLLPELFKTGQDPEELITQRGLRQTNDTGALEALCQAALAQNPKAVQEYLAGKTSALNALKGPIMKATQGKANPKLIDSLLQSLLSDGGQAAQDKAGLDGQEG
jgi:aspartyl-tRNA(Asn)/glutamyl-tRNA(Gln) amidotransferase subunit B